MPGHDLADLARLALDRVPENKGRHARRSRNLRGGFERHLRRGDHHCLGPGETRVAKLRRLVRAALQMLDHGGGARNAVFGQNGAGLGEGGWVRHGWA